MALEHILAAIRRETAAEVDRIAAESKAALESVAAQARRDAAAAEERAAASRDAAAASARERIVNRARLDADRRLHSAAEEVYLEMKREVAAKLATVRSTNDYHALLAQLLEECLALLPPARRVHVAPADGPAMAAIVADHHLDGFEVVTDVDTLGGLELRSGDGRAIRNTFEARLERADGHLRRLVQESVPPLRELSS